MKICSKCQKLFSDDANFCPVCAARLSPVEGQGSAAPVDPLAQRYELGERLGGSRTGAVHRARDRQTGMPAAVKLVAPAVVALPGVAQRFERELKQLERVQSAGVARVLASGRRGDAAQPGESWWVAYELLDGAQTLAEAITARGPVQLDEAAHLVEVIGEALIEAAQVGVVHRDLAPKNVLFAGSDIKLINFSVPVPTERTPGVPEFVAPEQVEGKAVDQRSNLYSLGALYYYVLTGQPVHGGAPDEVQRAHVHGSIRTPSSLAAVPAPVEAVIMRALDKSPTKRFLTVRQFVDEVARVARGEAADPRSAQPAGRGARPKAELVQTLLGVRGGQGALQAAVAQAMAAQAASAQAIGPALAPVAGELPSRAPAVPAEVAGAAPNPGPAGASPAATIQGMPAAASALAAPPLPAAVAVAVPSSVASPVAPPSAAALGAPGASPLAPGPSPWAPPAPAGLGAPPAGERAAGPQLPQQHAALRGEVLGGPPAMPAPIAGPPPAAASPPSPLGAPPAAPLPAGGLPGAPIAGAPAQLPSAAAAADPLSAPAVAGVAPPIVTNAPKPSAADTKGKFRETLWFKKGDLDVQAAVEAAEARARTGKDVVGDRADSLPIDERYKDDGSVSRGDKDKYSLRTGATQMMTAVRDPAASASKVSEEALIGELKAGRGKVIGLIALAVVALAAIALLVAR
jgi:serine/threonine-protein kinase